MAIARAIIRKPEIYASDSSLPVLDFKMDSIPRQASPRETGNATMVIAAQHVSTIINTGRIIMMDEGKVMGIDTHREFLDTCGICQEIVRSQSSEEEVNT